MTDKPTEFEMLTAAAYLAFYSARVDVCVVECGMGGGKDATNVIDSPLLSVITGIAIDHTAYLGTTLADIAREKAGIIKSGCPALISDIIPREAKEVIRTTADEIGAPLISDAMTARIVREPRLDGTVLDVEGIGEVRIPLIGNFQMFNATLAISAAKILEEHFPTITPLRIIDGIEATEWRGRFEVLSRDPLFIFDGAHNLDGIENALESITATFTFMDAIVITGVLRDKEYEEMARRLPRWWRIITVTPPSPRALTAVEYKEVFKNLDFLTVSAAPNVRSAVARALSSIIKPNTPILCIGSLYLYREVTEALKAELSK
jgi:dihydrofolate synthase/folylpolyglutamate synthase